MKALRFVKTGFVILAVLCLFNQRSFTPSDFAHPLDPLSKDEITTVAATLKAENKATDSSRSSTLCRNSNDKLQVIPSPVKP